MHFRVGSAERDRWYEHMAAALSETQVSATIEEQMLEYFAMAANHLIQYNRLNRTKSQDQSTVNKRGQ